MHVLLRESGGIGDIICCGAAARAIKAEQPQEKVVLMVPEEFHAVAGHLDGVDLVASLGPLEGIVPQRRVRDAPLDLDKYPYLAPLRTFPEATVVDLYCPSFLNESTQPGDLEFNRCQLFAIAAGVQDVGGVRPQWSATPEEEEWADGWFKKHALFDRFPMIAVQLRATCPARSLSPGKCSQLLERLSTRYQPVVLDCVLPQFALTPECTPCVNFPVPLVAAIVERCGLSLSIDSFLIHLSAALGKPTIGIYGPTNGVVAMQTYPNHEVINGSGVDCLEPCNYNTGKKWSRDCRKQGCERMLSHSVDAIVEKVDHFFSEDER